MPVGNIAEGALRAAACRRAQTPVAAGDSRLTPGFRLSAKYIVHCVGPTDGKDATALRGCYTSALDLCRENGIGSIAFCCIATGIFGFPNRLAAATAIAAVRDWLATSEANRSALTRVVFCLFLPRDVALYEEMCAELLPAGLLQSR